MKSEPTVIDPALLESLGRVVPAVPPERPTVNPLTGSKSSGIVKSLEPPRAFEFGIDLHTPAKK